MDQTAIISNFSRYEFPNRTLAALNTARGSNAMTRTLESLANLPTILERDLSANIGDIKVTQADLDLHTPAVTATPHATLSEIIDNY